MRTDIDIPVAERLAKLLRLLASDRDGEVVAAVTALKKTLEGAGLDHHDLADMVTGKRGRGITPQEMQNVEREAYRAGFRDGQRNAEHDDGRDDDDEISWHDVAKFCLERSQWLEPHESDFVKNMERWTRRGRKPSEKQRQWLDGLNTRLQRRERQEKQRRRARKS